MVFAGGTNPRNPRRNRAENVRPAGESSMAGQRADHGRDTDRDEVRPRRRESITPPHTVTRAYPP